MAIDYGRAVLSGLRAISDARNISSPRAPVGLSEVGKCVRRLWYQTHGYEPTEETSLESYMLFSIGHGAEASIIEGLRAAGVIVLNQQVNGDQIEVKVWNIPGHVDGIVLEPTVADPPPVPETALAMIYMGLPIPGYKKLLLECKSISEYGYRGLAQNGVELSYYDYFLQCQSYATGLGLDGILFIAVNKGGGGKDRKGVQKPVIYTERLQVIPQLVANHMSRIIPLLQAETVPERPYTAPEFACSYCPFTRLCWSTENE